ncbi:uncharacterized protein LOC127284367 [Leptopilina boulardi]|uniref:uncharacterized protein LOC127284367 n=1 Tax=Leptopilina boulardi TaxID=63433 RepID=UPI0021F5A653|nr:uncharacterized protein LOC127284367 [Leptopilina boulardi]
MTEVFRAQMQLREPLLRPKASEGCLNCGQSGHSHRLCKEKYSGKYCQKCANMGFSTEDCPWPHYAMVNYQVPECNRCKHCWRPRNLPDANCYECRRRVITAKTTERDKTIRKLGIKVATSQQPTKLGAIKKELPMIPTTERMSHKTADKKSSVKSRTSPTREVVKVEIPTDNIPEESYRFSLNALSPLDSDDNNTELWKTLSEVINLSVDKKEE